MPTPTPSLYTAVREVLTADLELPNDEAIVKVKARGVTKPDADIRKVLNHTRSELRRRKKSKGAPAKAPSAYTITRELLIADPTLSNDAVFTQIKARGVAKSDADIRSAIRRTRSDMLVTGPKSAPVAARATVEPKAVGAGGAAAADETTLFAALGLVNKTAQLCGGVAKARAIAEAIRSSGGIDAFLRRLDLVAEILGSDTEL